VDPTELLRELVERLGALVDGVQVEVAKHASLPLPFDLVRRVIRTVLLTVPGEAEVEARFG
jgi:predicted component of type VI protein secretion system